MTVSVTIRRLLPIIGCLLLSPFAPAQPMNGFDLSDALVPAEQVLFGGPGKGGIPAIDQPDFIAAGSATHLRDDDPVLGIVHQGIARAYPIAILNWHEVVNDRYGDEAVAVTYCPLCGTGMAFVATGAGRKLDFGVSGLLYNSDVLLYDRQTNSLWSQILAMAISGPMKSTQLAMLPVTHTSWAEWKARQPDSRVLSPATGYVRPYLRDPYAGYASSPDLLFSVAFRAQGLHPKERVIGLRIAGAAKAYPFVELAKTSGVVDDRVGGRSVTIRFDRKTATAIAVDDAGRQLPAIVGYWFAWYAFHPETERYEAVVGTPTPSQPASAPPR